MDVCPEWARPRRLPVRVAQSRHFGSHCKHSVLSKGGRWRRGNRNLGPAQWGQMPPAPAGRGSAQKRKGRGGRDRTGWGDCPCRQPSVAVAGQEGRRSASHGGLSPCTTPCQLADSGRNRHLPSFPGLCCMFAKWRRSHKGAGRNSMNPPILRPRMEDKTDENALQPLPSTVGADSRCSAQPEPALGCLQTGGKLGPEGLTLASRWWVRHCQPLQAGPTPGMWVTHARRRSLWERASSRR